MNKNEIKKIILEEIKSVLSEMGPDSELYPDGYDFGSPEEMVADSRPEEDDDITPPGIEDMSPDPAFGPNPSFVEEDLDEGRDPNIFKLSRDASREEVLRFMQRVNNVLKTYKSPGQKRSKKRFTPEEMKALADVMVNPKGFGSQDIVDVSLFKQKSQANNFLKALELKGLIQITSQLKKSQEPARDPNAPETRGRNRKPDEFNTPDDAMDMDMGDFEDLDLSGFDDIYENKTMHNLEKYIKQQIKEAKVINEISLDKLAAAMSVAIKRGEHKRAEQLSNTWFRNFIGKDFGEGLGKLEKANLNTQSDKKEGIELNFEQDVRIFYTMRSDDLVFIQDGGAIQPIKDLEIERGAVRKLQQIIKAINPESKIITGTSAFSVAGLRESEKYIRKQIKEAKSPLASKMKEVETRGRIAALETKLAAVAEMIEETNGRLTRIDEDEEFTEMMDKNAVKGVRKQLKELERAKLKLEKEYARVSGGRKKEKVVGEVSDDDIPENPNDPKDHPALPESKEQIKENMLDPELKDELQRLVPDEWEGSWDDAKDDFVVPFEGTYMIDMEDVLDSEFWPDNINKVPTDWVLIDQFDLEDGRRPNDTYIAKNFARLVPGEGIEIKATTERGNGGGLNESILRMQKLAGLLKG